MVLAYLVCGKMYEHNTNRYRSYTNYSLYVVLLTLISAKLHSLKKYYPALELGFSSSKLEATCVTIRV